MHDLLEVFIFILAFPEHLIENVSLLLAFIVLLLKGLSQEILFSFKLL